MTRIPQMDAQDIIQLLGLVPLEQEGGFFKETYRSSTTAIFYLITPQSYSKKHRLKTTDEIFHFYMGDAVEMQLEDPDGKKSKLILGQHILAGEKLQVLVPANHWQESKLKQGGKWALLGTTCTPAFRFEDFELG